MLRKNEKNQKSKKGMIGIVCIIVVVLFVAGGFFMTQKATGTKGYTSTVTTKETIETYYAFSGNVSSETTQNVMAEDVMQIEEIHIKKGDKVSIDTLLFTTKSGTEIKSKIKGTINQIFVEEDQQVAAGTQLAEIIDFDNLEVLVQVDEYDIEAVEVGEKIEVNIPALDKEIEGTIAEISLVAESKNGVSYFTATVKLDQDSEIAVGMSAEASILNEQEEDVIALQMRALEFDEENNPYVYVLEDGKRLVKTALVTGINDGTKVEIRSGLGNNQTVYYKEISGTDSSNAFMPPMLSR